MVRYSNNHNAHPMVIVFVFSLVVLTGLTVAVSFNQKPRTLDSSAQIAPAHPTRTPTPGCSLTGNCLRTGTVCCSGTRVFDQYCLSGARCVAAITTPTRTPTRACPGTCSGNSDCYSCGAGYYCNLAIGGECIRLIATGTRTPTPRLTNCGGVPCEPYNCHCVDDDSCTSVRCIRPTSTRTRTPTVRTTRTRTPTPRLINCGGELCDRINCQCLGGSACTGYACVPDIRTSCGNQDRWWCKSYQSGPGYSCCQSGYVCGANGIGCVRP